MRKLSEQELKLVQTAIIAKEISVMEILAEVYDHYISHLEGFSESEFKNELAVLDSKWTYLYCRVLQDDFIKNSDKAILKLHWQLIKGYFTWPKILSTVILFGFLYGLSQILTPAVFAFSTILPAIILSHIFNFSLVYSSRKKFKALRRIFNLDSKKFKLNYAESNSLIAAFGTLLALPSILINGPKMLENSTPEGSVNWILMILILIAFLISLVSFSAYEAWKIKSKTALL
ncbi:hypothetical protein [Algoriphagus sp. AK58]|uniref:hypothetical protein n=1 Tax=Algoriphagus sp. AK58 TaxID=1406877 RepID=UPI001650AB2A|nr:hypothetical protein [Algoriphagus sp. AK58]MBC6366608.1 hypothetical protein [Algoriphagus sp. AK58]